MYATITKFVKDREQQLIECRRDLHKYAEVAWTEFRTASLVADKLTSLGYQVLAGEQVIDAASMMGVPSPAQLEEHAQRALTQGAHPSWVEKMQGGKTGVVAIMDFAQPGPTIAFRFDMDANDAIEAQSDNHRPWKDGFSSVNQGAMHACAHDGHTAIGLLLAELVVQLKGELKGRVKLIFQPAEEGVRGAKAMVASGVVDDVDYLLGMHLGIGLKSTGTLTCNTEGFLATTKLDATFQGVPAHAGAAPETGRNALLAAAAATLNLHAISRHSQGASRINVGVFNAGTGRNVIPPNAVLKIETRGTTTEINEYIYDEAVRILNAAAQMYGVSVDFALMGGAAGCGNDAVLVEQVSAIAVQHGLFKEIMPSGNIGGSEDCTYFMERVQQCGGKAAYLMVGANLSAGHHDSYFDFDESVLAPATILLGHIIADIAGKKN